MGAMAYMGGKAFIETTAYMGNTGPMAYKGTMTYMRPWLWMVRPYMGPWVTWSHDFWGAWLARGLCLTWIMCLTWGWWLTWWAQDLQEWQHLHEPRAYMISQLTWGHGLTLGHSLHGTMDYILPWPFLWVRSSLGSLQFLEGVAIT